MLPVATATAHNDLVKLLTAAPPQLQPVEALRASTLLEDAAKKLQYLRTFDCSSGASRVKGAAGESTADELSKAIHEQKELEKRYEALAVQRSGLRGVEERRERCECQEKLQDVLRRLGEAHKALRRILVHAPNKLGNQSKLAAESRRVLQWYEDALGDLETSANFENLASRVEFAKQEAELLNEIRRSSRESVGAVKLLEAALLEESAALSQSAARESEEIHGLQKSLQRQRAEGALRTSQTCRQLTGRGEALARLLLQKRQDAEDLLDKRRGEASAAAKVNQQSLLLIKEELNHLSEEMSRVKERWAEESASRRSLKSSLEGSASNIRLQLDEVMGRLALGAEGEGKHAENTALLAQARHQQLHQEKRKVESIRILQKFARKFLQAEATKAALATNATGKTKKTNSNKTKKKVINPKDRKGEK
eukprot:GHVT01041794.1.p1 GENE.GHVT01041794.1~~GHVT01041794.1.p1  ORF type:complete len:425 (+),score=130.42 GHVT01041794.1:346-1620(+)